MQQGTHEAQLLLHAAGELAGLAFAERLHAGHAQQFGQEPLALGAGDAEEVGVELHVFIDGQIDIEAEALGHVADRILNGLGVADHVMAGHPRLTLAGIQQAAQHAQRSGLAGAVRTDQPEDLAAGDLQVQVVHGRQGVEAPGEVPGANDPFHQFPVTISASAGMLDFSSWRGLSTSILTR